MTLARWLRGAALGLALGIVLGALLTARVIVAGEEQLRLSDAAFNRGDLRASLLHARRAATFYAPGAAHVRGALERMMAIAKGAESAQDREVAESAWWALRGAALETRHLWVPHGSELTTANRNLARLAREAGTAPAASAGQQAEALLEQLERDQPVRPSWAVLLGIGFSLAVCGLTDFAVNGIRPAGGLRWARAGRGVAMLLAGVVCWALAVWRA